MPIFKSVWFEIPTAPRWTIGVEHDPPVRPDGSNVIGALFAGAHRGAVRRYRDDIIEAEAKQSTGPIAGSDGAGVSRVNNLMIIENDYLDEFEVRMSASELLRLMDWWLAIEESDDFTNPDASFEPIEIEYEAVPVD